MNSKICIIVSNYYTKISNGLLHGAIKAINKRGNKKKIIKNVIYVSGAFEIPVTIARNMKSYDAFIALGCIIKGKTPHFNILSNSVINGLMHLSIYYKKPIGNGIITCLNKKQALERSHQRKKNKGEEAAIAIMSVLKIFKKNYEST